MTVPNLCNEVLENAIKVHETCENAGCEITPLDAVAVQAMKELLRYRQIGTVEECRAAVEKQKAKRPDGGRDIDGKDYLICPNCCAIVADGEWTAKFCPDCGQKLDWSGEE
jgi:hypothetical protein